MFGDIPATFLIENGRNFRQSLLPEPREWTQDAAAGGAAITNLKMSRPGRRRELMLVQ